MGVITALGELLSPQYLLMMIAGTMGGIYKNAVFDTNRKSLLRHISAEKGLK